MARSRLGSPWFAFRSSCQDRDQTDHSLHSIEACGGTAFPFRGWGPGLLCWPMQGSGWRPSPITSHHRGGCRTASLVPFTCPEPRRNEASPLLFTCDVGEIRDIYPQTTISPMPPKYTGGIRNAWCYQFQVMLPYVAGRASRLCNWCGEHLPFGIA
jgi:hypothetical protein